MELPKPPEETELRNIIDKLAQFVARNGPEFEHMTKQKQKENPKFSFLFGGEYFNYYQYKVTTEQAILKQKQRSVEQQAIVQHSITQQSIQSAPWQQQQQQHQLQQQMQEVQEQIRQSEQNLSAQNQMLLQQQQVQIDEVIRKAQDEKLIAIAQEADINLEELDKVLQPIVEQCTKDAISSGKGWIFNNAVTPPKINVISEYLLKKVISPTATFDVRLHLVYLINDVLHHCVRKNAEDLKNALGKVVVPIFCTTGMGVDEDKQQKLSKLLKLWETHNYFDGNILEKLRNPAAAVAAYQAGIITEHASYISSVTTAIQAQYAMLQKQHQDYVTHLTAQMQQIQQAFGTITKMAQIPKSENSTPPLQAQPSNGNFETRFGEMGQQSMPGGTMDAAKMSQTMHMMTSNQNNMLGIHPGMAFSNGPPNANFASGPQQQFAPQFSQLGPNYMHGGFNQGGQPYTDQMSPQFQGMGPSAGNVTQDQQKNFPAELREIMMPSVPYFDLPAGLMVPLVALEEHDYTALDPNDIRLPPPAPPSQRLIAAVELFYSAPTHERPRNSDGWEQLGLYEFFKAKSNAKKRIEDDLGSDGEREDSPENSQDSHGDGKNENLGGSSSPLLPTPTTNPVAPIISMNISQSPDEQSSPPRRRYREDKTPPGEIPSIPGGESPVNRSTSFKRGHSPSTRFSRSSRSRSASRSRSRSRSRSGSRSRSRTPPSHRGKYARHSSRSKSRSRSRSRSRSKTPPGRRERSVSPTPVPSSRFSSSFSGTIPDQRLDESNKGHQLLKKMGWSGMGLGASEQGIQDPIHAGDVRDRQDQYKGVGISLNDPYESFRKSKGQAFINRMKARAEELGKN